MYPSNMTRQRNERPSVEKFQTDATVEWYGRISNVSNREDGLAQSLVIAVEYRCNWYRNRIKIV